MATKSLENQRQGLRLVYQGAGLPFGVKFASAGTEGQRILECLTVSWHITPFFFLSELSQDL